MNVHKINPYLRILHLEDSADDAFLIGRQVAEWFPNVRIFWVRDKGGFIAALERYSFELVLADYNIPGFPGCALLQWLEMQYPDLPIIFITGTLADETLAQETIMEKADGFVLKVHLEKLRAELVEYTGEPHSAYQSLEQAKKQIEMNQRLIERMRGYSLNGSQIPSERFLEMSPYENQLKPGTRMSDLPVCVKCGSEFTYEDGALYVCPECGHEWAKAEAAETEDTTEGVFDAHGTALQDGDSVTVIKDLKVKGTSQVVKVGTKVKNIRLVGGDHDIDCKIDGIGAMKLKSEFVKKA